MEIESLKSKLDGKRSYTRIKDRKRGCYHLCDSSTASSSDDESEGYGSVTRL